MTSRPAVPAQAVSWMLPELDSLATDIATAILLEVPDYARPGAVYPRVVRRVARDAVRQFVTRIADPEASWDVTAPGDARRTLRDVGRMEAVRGRDLDALHAALRVGARVIWERLEEKARLPAADAEVLIRIGEGIRCDEQLAVLVVLADAELAGLLSHQVLAPLGQLRPQQADRLAETLLAWLESADDATVAARLLHVHPQTVRYRLRQLAELFGDALRDPDARFSLQVALRARHLLGPA